ncbi:MAG: bifunctional 5,10-methylenetetrahydrofolate dehydrogenase/5,10-methenyltetrahydrofolate cyclohydrolase [Candidatus Doudnabacteria bacterium]|nr:bifunctional 5,10-methylenetetrahydrofolate dehydrogenase/5,10-methenyltetrahydrofolate cyclohydrolase [Candidatus Doudnabacteria bacterium]
MSLIDGRKLADTLLEEFRRAISTFSSTPLLVDLVVGDDPVTLSYVRVKEKTAVSIGIGFRLEQLSKHSKTSEVLDLLKRLQKNDSLCGLIVQLPLPASIDKAKVLGAIPAMIDVDCIGSENLSAFYSGSPRYIPPAAAAVMHILSQLPVDFSFKTFVILGQGELVGRPVRHLIRKKGWNVKSLDRATPNMEQILKQADVVVLAAGQPKLVTGQILKPGAIVIDAGTSESGGNIVGDADRESVEKVASYYAPVPGGVGPLTVAMLFRNLLSAYRLKHKRRLDPHG